MSIVAVDSEVEPVTVSPIANFCCDEIKSLLLPRSSTRTSAVAFDVLPVIVSPTTNLPVVPLPTSVLILSPRSPSSPSTRRWLTEFVSKRILSIVRVRVSSAASKNL